MKRQLVLPSALLSLALLYAAPAAADSDCSMVFNLRSLDSGVPTTIVFTNAASDPRAIVWIGYDGKVQQYAVVAPGDSLSQQTFVNAAWMVKDSGGKCRGIFITKNSTRTITMMDKGNSG